MILFELSGLNDLELQKKVHEAVEEANYSEEEMNDVRIPAQYDILEYVFNVDRLLERLISLEAIISYNADDAINKNKGSIKSKIKKALSKLFRWYLVPLAETQSIINREHNMIICDTISYIQKQSATIIKLQKELDETRGKNV